MSSTRVLLLAALAFASLVSTSRAEYVQIVAFGDSLSDTGNVYIASGGTFPPAPYAAGRFSNGPVWVESLANKLGVPTPTPSVMGGTNNAWAAAESGSGFSPDLGVPNLLTQISAF